MIVALCHEAMNHARSLLLCDFQVPDLVYALSKMCHAIVGWQRLGDCGGISLHDGRPAA